MRRQRSARGRGQSCPLKEKHVHFAPRRNRPQKEMIPSIKYLQDVLGQKNGNGLKLNMRCNSSPFLPACDSRADGCFAVASFGPRVCEHPRQSLSFPAQGSPEPDLSNNPRSRSSTISHSPSLFPHLLNRPVTLDKPHSCSQPLRGITLISKFW